MNKELLQNPEIENKPRIDFIWTLDRICAWNCSFCCVDALYVRKEGQDILIQSNGHNLSFPFLEDGENIYTQAAKRLGEERLALSVEKKLEILDNLRGVNPRIDFSGGDLLLLPENLEVIKRASELFGRNNIGVTTTGVGMEKGHIADYLDYVGEVEFTYDQVDEYDYRQSGYNNSNLNAIMKLCDRGVKTRALIPLTPLNSNSETIRNIYTTLHSVGVDSVLLMRVFPVGRGILSPPQTIEKEEYQRLIGEYKDLEEVYSIPRIKLQCALKYLFPDQLSDNPCDFLSSSLGISDMGELIASAWAYNQNGEIMSPEFVLGDLTVSNVGDLISQERIQGLISRKDENFGHCKIFAYLNDSENQGVDRFFTKADPLYSA